MRLSVNTCFRSYILFKNKHDLWNNRKKLHFQTSCLLQTSCLHFQRSCLWSISRSWTKYTQMHLCQRSCLFSSKFSLPVISHPARNAVDRKYIDKASVMIRTLLWRYIYSILQETMRIPWVYSPNNINYVYKVDSTNINFDGKPTMSSWWFKRFRSSNSCIVGVQYCCFIMFRCT